MKILIAFAYHMKITICNNVQERWIGFTLVFLFLTAINVFQDSSMVRSKQCFFFSGWTCILSPLCKRWLTPYMLHLICGLEASWDAPLAGIQQTTVYEESLFLPIRCYNLLSYKHNQPDACHCLTLRPMTPVCGRGESHNQVSCEQVRGEGGRGKGVFFFVIRIAEERRESCWPRASLWFFLLTEWLAIT